MCHRNSLKSTLCRRTVQVWEINLRYQKVGPGSRTPDLSISSQLSYPTSWTTATTVTLGTDEHKFCILPHCGWQFRQDWSTVGMTYRRVHLVVPKAYITFPDDLMRWHMAFPMQLLLGCLAIKKVNYYNKPYTGNNICNYFFYLASHHFVQQYSKCPPVDWFSVGFVEHNLNNIIMQCLATDFQLPYCLSVTLLQPIHNWHYELLQ